MKKNVLLAGLLVCFFACSSPSKEGTTAAKVEEVKVEEKPATASANPDYDKGLELVAQSDCLGCHKINEASVGPSYAAIATKYEATEDNINLLASKIMKGGQGVWGEVPMAAHPTLSKEDAVQMVKYIMLLKDEKK
ncbi:MAG: c-type cytochrome [Gloeobacteraceae cyanobacterium ES-bin-316]|nr:c-type cytochrome [Ferruginibacter sp.]